MTEYELQKAVCKYLDLKGVLYCGSMGGQYQIFKSQRIKQKLTNMKTNGLEQLKKIEENYNKNKNLKEMEDAMEKLPIEIINLWNEIKKRKINK